MTDDLMAYIYHHDGCPDEGYAPGCGGGHCTCGLDAAWTAFVRMRDVLVEIGNRDAVTIEEDQLVLMARAALGDADASQDGAE
jgi:hypothetical protein